MSHGTWAHASYPGLAPIGKSASHASFTVKPETVLTQQVTCPLKGTVDKGEVLQVGGLRHSTSVTMCLLCSHFIYNSFTSHLPGTI